MLYSSDMTNHKRKLTYHNDDHGVACPNGGKDFAKGSARMVDINTLVRE
jgi:hypothetical protein